MRRQDTQRTERSGVGTVDRIVTDDLNWLFREQAILDYGIDAQVEVVDVDEVVSGRLLGLQIRTGASRFVRPVTGGWTFRENSNHLAYWLGHSLPVLVVLVDQSGAAYWQVVNPRTVRETKKGFSIRVPSDQRLDASARDPLLELATRNVSLLGSLPEHYALLPGSVVTYLKAAEALDRLGSARLAERLSSGRANPDLTADSLLAAKPSWLAGSRAADVLWTALGEYAMAYALNLQAGSSLELAAACGGSGSPRLEALAGLVFVSVEPDKARHHLEAARDQGQVLLADAGLAMLAVPPDDARRLEVPRSLLNATQEELDSQPILLRFLAEVAIRSDDDTTAAQYLQRAVRHSSPGTTAARLRLAQHLLTRMVAEGHQSASERRTALAHAQAALEDRRRWAGPSAEALSVILDIYIATGRMAEAVAAALPVMEGGTALETEALSPEVSRRGALAALACQNQSAYAFFLQNLPDGPARQEILVRAADFEDRPRDDRVAAWTVLLQVADDELAARCISRLAQLGLWPARADDMRSRSVLPQVTYDTLRAVYRASSGDRDVGLEQLRQLSHTSPLAAQQLVLFLEGNEGGLQQAIDECERQAQRWGDPMFIVHLIDLLRRAGGEDRAAGVIERHINNEGLADELRVNLCRWFVQHKADKHLYQEAASMARTGLGIQDDPDLAWGLVIALFNDGNVREARDALARYRPEPTRQEEVRLWMQLHLGVGLSEADARQLTDLIDRQPDAEMRAAMAGFLVREVVLQQGPHPAHYSADVVETARALAGTIGVGPTAGLVPLADDNAIREVLQSEEIDPTTFQRLVEEVRRGKTSLAELARRTHRSYGAALIHRPAGLHVAIDASPSLRSSGERAVVAAFDANGCVVDLSSLYLLSLLDEDDQLGLRSAAPSLVVTRAAVNDMVRTRDLMHTLTMASYTASLTADGRVERHALSPKDAALIQERANNLERLVNSVRSTFVAGSFDTGTSGVELASISTLPMWCDDTALRQHARARGIPSFDIIDLVTVLRSRRIRVDETRIRQRLLAEYVVDLPVTAPDMVRVASETAWNPGPVHTALARREWWVSRSNTWTNDWCQIARSARRHSAEALIAITRAALIGAVGAVSIGLAGQRFQTVLMLALVSSFEEHLLVPADFLTETVAGANPAIVPAPGYLLRSLAAELRRRGVPDSDAAAMQLLPGTL